MQKGVMQPEDVLQAQCFQWHWNNFPGQRRLLFAVPNGEDRHPAVANKLKATGVVAGASDLIYLWKGNAYFIEMKTIKGTQSDNQVAFEKAITAQGFTYVIKRTFEDFKNYILSLQ